MTFLVLHLLLGGRAPVQPIRREASTRYKPCVSGFSAACAPPPVTMDSSLRSLLLLEILVLPEAWTGSHSLKYFYTGWTGPELGEPRFISAGYVDDQEFTRYDSDSASRREEPRAEWIKRVVLVDPDYWERETRIHQGNAQTYPVCLEILRSYYNHSEGDVHTIQRLFGCEVSPDGRLQRGFYQHAYDGRDYIVLDTETWTWRTAEPQAEYTKLKWEAAREAERRKAYLEGECVMWLHKYLQMGKEALTRTDPPSARVTRHTPLPGKVTLRCRAQDFYPAEISLTWLRDGEEQLQDTEFIETRPGGDGTFQKWAAVEVPPGQEGSYTCRVQHRGLAEPFTLKWESPSSSTWIIVGVLAGVLLTSGMVGVVIWREKNEGAKGGAYDLAASNDKTQGPDVSDRMGGEEDPSAC